MGALRLDYTVISVAEPVTGGAFLPPGARDSIRDLPPFCRVAGEIRATIDSHIIFELWMPLSGWNGKFMAVGNGGWAGGVTYNSPGADLGRPFGLSGELRRGYAVVSTNTGHEGEPGLQQARFAYYHPHRLTDFGYRAVHEMTVKGKAITEAFYGRAPRYSYLVGCSTGGKQGLTEAQRFPADFDGIVAGAPANNWSRLMIATLDLTLAAIGDSSRYLTQRALSLLHDAALTACDTTDAVRDSIIGNPAACHFDPAALQCGGASAPGTCLTAGQVQAAKRIYAGAIDPTDGRLLYPGLSPGSEPFWGAFATPGRPFPIPVSYYTWLVFGDSTWDWRTFDLSKPSDHRAYLESEARLTPVLAAIDPNLRAFRARGGKLIQFHGWDDQLISPRNSIDYYESVLSFLGAARHVRQFYRLFMVPGMAHCALGPGTDAFDAQAALEDWVERGVAPDTIMASDPPSRTPQRKRPLCPYPEVAVYKGSGDARDASSFACR